MVVPSRMLEAKVEAPHMVEVPSGRQTVLIDVRTEITNVSDFDYVVHAPTKKHEHFWQILDENNREIARGKAADPGGAGKSAGTEDFFSETIAAGLSIHDSHRVELPTQRLKDGRTYIIRSEVFGQSAEAEFVAVRPQRSAPKKKPKKTAKSAIKKKIAAKKKAIKRRAKKK